MSVDLQPLYDAFAKLKARTRAALNEDEPILTPQEYAMLKGLACPYCVSEEISAMIWHNDDGHLAHRCRCRSCGKFWVEVYELAGYESER